MQELSPEHVAKLREMTRGIEVAMITTIESSMSLRSRPMTLLHIDDSGTLWFFASDDSDVVLEGERSAINVAYVDIHDNRYVSVAGRCAIVRDRERVRALWNAGAEEFFPSGPEDPNAVLLRVRPECIEYWDVSARKSVTLFELIGSALGQQPETSVEHGVIEPSAPALS